MKKKDPAAVKLGRVRISERVKVGLETARAKGKRLGRPKVNADAPRIAALRKAGRSWSEITRETGLTKGTAQRAFYSLPKKISERLGRSSLQLPMPLSHDTIRAEM